MIRRLAVGGMAELYLARANGIEGFQKLVALKRILPQHSGSEDFVSMFLDEARLVATLAHGNIAQVYDIGESPEGLFFTMEYVHGEDVRNLLRASNRTKRRVPLEHVLSVVVGAAAGLHYAHEKSDETGRHLGIVHRDVSPSNVIVSYDGCVKLIDFGVAKAAHRQTETRAGTLKGKIAYMSPEQCEGGAIDRRSDVFSLGILLYELTTGQRLFTGDNEFGLMKQIVYQDVPPPSTRRASYPEQLEAIVLKALERKPSRRYPTAQALQLDLEAFARSNGISISSANLGRYMSDLFADRIAMRAESESVVPSGLGEGPAESDFDIQIVEQEQEQSAGPVATWMFDVPEVIKDAASGRLTPSPVSTSMSPVIPAGALRRSRWPTFAAVVGTAMVIGIALAVVFGGSRDGAAQPESAIAPAAAVRVTEPAPVPAAADAAQTATMPDRHAVDAAVVEAAFELEVGGPAAELEPGNDANGGHTARETPSRTKTSTKTKTKGTRGSERTGVKKSKKRSKSRKHKSKKRRGWDPDSALPPPG